MNQVLSEIKSIPGIVGGFLFDSIQGVQLSNLPPVFKEANLNKIGTVLDKMYTMSQSGLTDIADLFLYYEESTLIIRKIGKTSYFIIISDPSLNMSLLTMSMNMHSDELKATGSGFDEANDNNEIISVESEQQAEAPSAKEIMANSVVADELAEMEAALCSIVGPMAKMVFEEVVQEWLQSQEPSQTTLPALVKAVTKEINDPDKEKSYLEMISPITSE